MSMPRRDPLKSLDDLAVRARREAAPEVDVSRAVIARLDRPQPSPIRPPAIFALASAVAAVVTAISGISLYNAMNDPTWYLLATP